MSFEAPTASHSFSEPGQGVSCSRHALQAARQASPDWTTAPRQPQAQADAPRSHADWPGKKTLGQNQETHLIAILALSLPSAFLVTIFLFVTFLVLLLVLMTLVSTTRAAATRHGSDEPALPWLRLLLLCLSLLRTSLYQII
jgi:hypothetical protein